MVDSSKKEFEYLRSAIHHAITNCEEIRSILNRIRDKHLLIELCQHNLLLKTQKLVKVHLAKEISRQADLTKFVHPSSSKEPLEPQT